MSWMVTDGDHKPVELVADNHPYHGFLERQYLDEYVSVHTRDDDWAGVVDGDSDALGQYGVGLLRRLWPCLEMVVPGDLVPRGTPADAQKTDLIFSHDGCVDSRYGTNRWGGNQSRSNYYVMFTALLTANTSDVQSVRCHGGEDRARKELHEVRMIPANYRHWSCCPSGHV